MISLEQAQKNNFATTSKAEWKAYAAELGLDPDPTADSKLLKKMVFAALGRPMDGEDGSHTSKQAVKAGKSSSTRLFPSYNLSTNGIWQGRRYRIRLPRPEGSKLARAEGVAWNGKHTYYIPYDEIDAVPEPIYNILKQNRRRRAMTVTPPGATSGESTTSWEFDEAMMGEYGVDEETKNRAGSLQEWYRSRGDQWFRDLSLRELQLIAARLEVSTSTNMGPGVPRRILDQSELLGMIFLSLYSEDDPEVAPDKRIEA